VDSALSDLTFIAKPMDMCKKIGEVMSEFPDHHLKAKYRGTFCYKKQSEIVNVGKNLNDTKGPWKGIKTKDGIYTIAISKFTPGKWPGFLEFADEAMKKAKAIIIDLRGNGGGDDSIGFELAEKLAGQKIETPIAPDVRRNTPETLTIWDNYLNVLKKNSNNEKMKKQLDIYIKENAQTMKKAFAGKIDEFTTRPTEDTGWKYDKTKGHQGPIYILQDKECGSSGESTIDFFEYFPNVTKVGFNTAGMIHFGNIGIVVLPNSSIQLNMPTKANKYKDARFIEFTGIKPDILLEESQDAYQHVLGILKD
jgi:C-terminal processing protease CtpA/Prc